MNKNLLSASGKEILIKSILQALTQHVMMCFKLPDSLYKRLNNIVFNYWWSASGNKAIHWSTKFQLYRPKKYGGMNFKEYGVLNDAFLAKQYWRMLENPSSVLNKLFQAGIFMKKIYLTPA